MGIIHIVAAGGVAHTGAQFTDHIMRLEPGHQGVDVDDRLGGDESDRVLIKLRICLVPVVQYAHRAVHPIGGMCAGALARCTVGVGRVNLWTVHIASGLPEHVAAYIVLRLGVVKIGIPLPVWVFISVKFRIVVRHKFHHCTCGAVGTHGCHILRGSGSNNLCGIGAEVDHFREQFAQLLVE